MASFHLLPAACLLLGTGMAGCIFDHCPPMSSAEWSHPGFYEFAQRRPEAVLNAPPAEGIPWNASEAWRPFALKSVSWFPSGEGRQYLGEHVVTDAGWSFHSDVDVYVGRGLNHSLETLRQEFDELLLNLTDVGPSETDALWDELVASKTELVAHLDRAWKEHVGFTYHVRLPGIEKLGHRIEAALAHPNGTVEDVSPAHRGVHMPNWSFGFDVPTLSLSVPDGPGTFAPTVGANDRVQIRLPQRLARNETGSRAWITEHLASLGLSQPTFQDWSFSTSVC
ncbi:MAG: hypothetical protein HYT80_06165 [Euryarchaeota archaeon]|nr:hypothetical protein [Euryarchaeota archaeon]